MELYNTVDGQFNVKPEDLQAFLQQYPDAKKSGSEKTTISSSKPEVVGEVKKIAAPVNLRGLQYLVDAIVGLEDIKSGVVGVADAAYMKLAGYSREEQEAAKKVRDIIGPSFIPGTPKKQLEVLDVLTSHKYIDETGRELDVSDLAREKEWGKMGELGFQYAASSAPSIAISMAGAPGVAILGLSTAGNTYFEDLANRPDESVEDITYNALLAGFSEAGTELLGGRFLRGLGDVAANASGKALEKAAKEYTEGFGKSVFKNIFKGGAHEAFTESLNSVIQETGNVVLYDDEVDKRKYMDGIINSALPAFMLGGKGGAFATLNNKNKQNLYKFVAPNDWKQGYFATGKKIDDTIRDVRRAKTPSQKKKLQKELDALIKIRDKKVADLTQSFDNMTDKEFVDYAKNLDKINENNAIINNKKFSETNQEKAEKENLKLIQENFDLVGKEYTADNIAVEKIIGEALKASEIIEKRLKKLKGINREDLEVKILENQEQVDKLIEEGDTNFDEKADGMFVGKNKKGKAQIYINKQVANLEGATNVVGHELLHYMISRQFKTDNASMKPLIDDLKSYLQKNHGDVYNRVQQRIDKFYTDENGNIKEGALEEYIEVFSDLISKQKIDLKDAESKGLRGKFDEVLLGFGLKDVKIETAQDLVKFINNYTNNINRQGLLGKLMGTKILDARIESSKLQDIDETEVQQPSKASRSKAVDAVNEIEQKLKNKLKAEGKDYTKDEFQKSNEFNSIFRSINLDNGPINNYIKSLGMSPAKTQKTIESVSDRLLKYNPQAERKTDSKKEITIGERIMSDTQFAKLDAARDLAIETKRETPTDIGETTKEGDVKLQVAAEPDTQQETLETEDISPQAEARRAAEKAKGKQKVESEFRRKIGIETDSDLYNKILNTARKALLRAYETGKTVRQIQRDLRDEANLYLFKDIKNFLGTKQYVSNLNKFREPIMKVMFTSDLVQMEREVADDKKVFTKFVKKLTTLKEVEDAVEKRLLPPSALNSFKRDKSVNLYEKANPTEKQFLSFFDIPTINPATGIRSGKRGTRKDQLAKYISGALTYDATLEVAQEPEIEQKRADIAELKGEVLAKDDLQQLAVAIERDPSVRFSINIPNANKGIDIIYGKGKDDGFMGKNFQKFLDDKNIEGRDKKHAIDEYLKRQAEVFEISSDAISIQELNKIKSKIPTYRKYELIAKRRLANIFKNSGLTKEGYVVEKLSEKDNNPDIRVTKDGKTVFAIEIKGNTARGISVTFNYKGKKGLEKSTVKEETENYNKKESLLIKNSNKVFEKMINAVEKTIGKDGYRYTQFGNLQFTLEAVDLIKSKGIHLDMYNSIEFITTADVANSYQQKKGKDGSLKPSHAIDMGNAGMFAMSNESDLQLEGLNNFSDQNVPIALTARVSFGRKNKAGTHRTISVRVEPQLNSLFFQKQNVSLINKSGNKNIEVKNIKPKLKTVGENIIKSSRKKVASYSKSKGASIFDFDETVGVSENFVIAKKGNITEKIPSNEWPLVGETLKEQGYEFDFTDFNRVTKGKPGPLLQKMKNQIKKYGPKNVFILTARAPESQTAIHEWLKSEGVNIPLENITGLGDSTGEAKAMWVLDKYANEGYNDMYFVDDAMQNVTAVQNVFNQLDIKGKAVQAKVKFSESMNNKFNDILEEVTGIETQKRFSDIKARKRGESKGKFRFFIPPSHEDFIGLLYNFMGKGKQGDSHRDFFEQALVRPLNRAYREIDTAKQAIANDYKALNKEFSDIKNKLTKKTPDGDFTFEDAIRVYLWNKHGHDIPGLSPTDQNNLVDLVVNDANLRNYADQVDIISKQETYVEPGKGWEGGNIKTDLIDATGKVGRAKYFTEFNENAEILFSEENLNKIEAAYGADFKSALEDMLYRIGTGINRPKGQHATTNKFMNYLNGSVGTVMFFNVRSAILQQMSIVNYINFADNNMFAAAKAFANQKQYWQDFAFIFNSDMLKQRRGGIGTDINGNDLAQAVAGSKNPTKVAISYLLKLGFLPTQIGDNIAIATGGATFYRNRINKYVKDGLSKKEAEAKAFTDFQDLTQSTQQSSRPDMTSQQQASWIGKLVLNFQNITSQYNRIIKKAALDIKNRRISPPYTSNTQSDLGNLSKILYYGGIQNVIFYSLQTALFAVMFDDDEDEDQVLKKRERVIQGSIDSILRGAGIYGAVASTLKNTIIKFKEQREKGYNKDESAVIMELLNFSPVVGIKARQIVNAEKTLNYNENVISEMETFQADNPQWSAVTNYTQALTNFPANRLYQKSINMRNALDKDYTNFQRVMFFSGYTTWSLGLGDSEAVIEAKEKIKINKANQKRKSKRKTFKGKKFKGGTFK